MRPFKSKDLTQQRAFSRPAASQQDHRLSLFDVEIEPVQDTAPVVLNNEIANRNDRHQCFPVK